MSNSDFLVNVLTEIFPEETNAVGSENVRQIAGSAPDLSEPSAGRAFDISGALEVLANAASFLSAVALAYDYLARKLGRAPNDNEVLESLFSVLSDEERQELIARTLAARATGRQQGRQ